MTIGYRLVPILHYRLGIRYSVKSLTIFKIRALVSSVNSDPRYIFFTDLILFLKYWDSYSNLWPSSYAYILRRALNQYRIKNLSQYLLINIMLIVLIC